MLKSFASEHSFFFSSRASARVSSLISKQTCQVISLIGKSFARFLGKPWFCNSILCYSLEIFLSPFFDNLSKEELILLCQAFHPLNQVLILLVNLDAYKRFVSKLQVCGLLPFDTCHEKLTNSGLRLLHTWSDWPALALAVWSLLTKVSPFRYRSCSPCNTIQFNYIIRDTYPWRCLMFEAICVSQVGRVCWVHRVFQQAILTKLGSARFSRANQVCKQLFSKGAVDQLLISCTWQYWRVRASIMHYNKSSQHYALFALFVILTQLAG